jgi:RNase P/RNase MRP subunit p30
LAQYADLHILPHPEDLPTCRRIAEILSVAGYSTIGLTVPTGLFRDKVAALRQVFSDNGLEVVLRVDLGSRSREELLRSLRRFRSAYDVIAVKCLSEHVARVACRDRRVDLVFFDLENPRIRFSHALANLLRGAIEVNLMSAVLHNIKGSVYGAISKTFSIAQEHDVKVVLSNGTDKPEAIRSPIQVAALATTLGLSQRAALDGIGSTPMSIVAENVERHGREYIEEGVRVVLSRAR